MDRSSKLALWALLLAIIAGCSDSNNSAVPAAPEEYSHRVVVTSIELENVDNGQSVLVDGGLVFGGVEIED